MSRTPKTHVVWFKRDLRIVDHEPLRSAVAAGPVVALYVFEPTLWNAPTADARHLQFLRESLNDLENALASIGIPLTFRTGEVTDVLAALHTELSIDTVWAHEETTDLNGYRRDVDVGRWANGNGVSFVEQKGRGVVRRLDDRDGWSKKWQIYMDRPVLPSPTEAMAASVSQQSPPSASALGLAASTCTAPQAGGRRAGLDVLSSFLDHRGEPYVKAMSSPVTAFDHSSRLSPHLAYGSLSARECYQASRKRREEIGEWTERGSWLKSLRAFETRLRWRDHFTQKLEDQPSLETQAMHPMFEAIRPDFDEDRFEALVAGRTGFPMVDACMRATTATGWLNFRMRAMLVSFASYHLWLDWRPVAELFARLWVDYEPGIHYPQHQMQSGVTGINAVRIYSPTKQVHDHDPTGVFVKEWVPELAEVDPLHIAEPSLMSVMEQQWSKCVIGVDYPAPIVDHSTAYRQAQDTIRAVKKLPEAKRISEDVLQRHGSRKKPSSRRKRS